jgi:hypothetical protein
MVDACRIGSPKKTNALQDVVATACWKITLCFPSDNILNRIKYVETKNTLGLQKTLKLHKFATKIKISVIFRLNFIVSITF